MRGYYDRSLYVGDVIVGDGSWVVVKEEGENNNVLTINQAFNEHVDIGGDSYEEEEVDFSASTDERLLNKEFVITHKRENGLADHVNAMDSLGYDEPFEGQTLSYRVIAERLTNNNELDPSGLCVCFNYDNGAVENILGYAEPVAKMDIKRIVAVSNYTPIK